MSTAKNNNDNNIRAIDQDTRKVINQTYDDTKNKARKAIDGTYRAHIGNYLSICRLLPTIRN